jgi:hypothetical protein
MIQPSGSKAQAQMTPSAFWPEAWRELDEMLAVTEFGIEHTRPAPGR